jgi:hypothetical protein
MPPRRPIPRDSDEVIAAKERMKPVDHFKVFSKDANGRLCEYNADGSFKPTQITGLPDEDVKKLNKGIAESKVFLWICSNPMIMASMSGKGWKPCKRSELEVIAPFTYGNETDDLYHHVDTILCWRPRAIDLQERIGLATYNRQVSGNILEGSVQTPNGIQQSEMAVTPGEETFTIAQPVE